MTPARTSKSVTLPAAQVADDFSVRLSDFASLPEALEYAAAAGTGMIFYDAAGQVTQAMTYAGIRDAALDLGGRLTGLGLLRGDRIGIVADMGGDFIELFFACQMAGLVAVPLPVITGLGGRHGYEKQLARVLETSGARAALGVAEILGSIRAAAEGLGVEFILTPAELATCEPSGSMLRPLGPDEASHIQFSSGSTRNPHGIEISQRALLANARSIAQDGVAFDRVERVVSWLPFYHDMGLIGCMVTAVACQYTVHYLHTDAFARRPMQWLQIISDKRGTISFSPTFGYDVCARRSAGKDLSHLDLSCWRHAGIGGRHDPAGCLRALHGSLCALRFSRRRPQRKLRAGRSDAGRQFCAARSRYPDRYRG